MQCFNGTDQRTQTSRAPGAPGIAFQAPLQQETGIGETIYLVEDDPRVLEGLSELLESLGKHVVSFATAQGFLDYRRTDSSACLIVDLMLPDMNGIELQQQLADRLSPPIIFISGYADVPSTVRAMKGGAVEFLTKPVSQEALVTAIEVALLEDRLRRLRHLEMVNLQSRYSLLTTRERQVFQLVVEGLLNKQAASALGISEVTLQVHRGQVMRKMAAGSFASLVRMATTLGIVRRDGERTDDKGRGIERPQLKDLPHSGNGRLRSFTRLPGIAQA